MKKIDKNIGDSGGLTQLDHELKVQSLYFSYTDVSENSGIPKSSIQIGFSIINHPFWGTSTSIFGNTHTNT